MIDWTGEKDLSATELSATDGSGIRALQLTVGNDRHVTDVGRVVHETTDLGGLSAVLFVACPAERDRAQSMAVLGSVPLRR